MTARNISGSVRDRLLNKARAEKLDFNLLLTRYALERMLYRLSISKQRDQFLLKGALLFDLWFDMPHRPTHDADFLGFGSAEIPHIEEIFRDICRIEVEDGVAFQPGTVKAAEIRKEATMLVSGLRCWACWTAPAARCRSISVLVMLLCPVRTRSTTRSSSARCRGPICTSIPATRLLPKSWRR